jgi:hypothetical protein
MNTALNTRARAFAGAITGALASLACFTPGTSSDVRTPGWLVRGQA